MAAPGGGEEVPVGGEEVPVFWLGSNDAEAVLWSLKRDRSFLSRAWISSPPAAFDWSSAPSASTGCAWTWFWAVGPGWEVVCCGGWMDEFMGWEDVTAPLKGCCSEAGGVLVLVDGTPATEETDTELLLAWGPGTVGTEVCADGGEMVEDEGGMLGAGAGTCEESASLEDWGDGLGSLASGTGVWVCVDIGGGETLPVEGGSEDVTVDGRDTGGKVVLVVEAAASGVARILVELGPRPASVDGMVAGSCSEEGGSTVLPLSKRDCLMLLKACWRIPDGADRERPSAQGGAGGKRE